MNKSMIQSGMTIHKVIEHICHEGFEAIADEIDRVLDELPQVNLEKNMIEGPVNYVRPKKLTLDKNHETELSR